MNQISLGFILTTAAGLSTLLGAVIILFVKKKTDAVIVSALAFAAGVMICVSLTDLIPEAFHMLATKYMIIPNILIILVFLVLGIIVSMMIDKYLPEEVNYTLKNGKLYRIGIISMVAIIMHNLPEGIATFMTTTKDISLGITLTIAIALHNIPEGISISVPLYYATNNKKKALLYTFVSGLSEPLGALLAYLFLSPFITDQMMGSLFAFIAGIMLHISFYELLPTSLKYQNKKYTYIFFFLGILLMCINHYCF